MFSDRTCWELSTNKITELYESFKKNNVSVLDLTISNPTKCEFRYPKDKIIQALYKDENIFYSPDSQGLLSAREAVCRYYAEKNINITPDQVFLTASTSEGYSFLFRLLANPCDNVLFPRPSYPLFEFLV